MSGAIKNFFIVIFLLGGGSRVCATSLNATAPDTKANPLSPSLQKAIHEAENLSLMKDRILATNVLLRNIKKANKEEGRILKEKLSQLSKYFYTDKGFQAYLAGKELFDKQKFADAADRLNEADDLENGNIDVLHLLTLSQLWLKKAALAEVTNKKALQVCPLDIDLQRDALDVYRDKGDWTSAVKIGEALTREFNDGSAQTLKDLGLAQFKVERDDALPAMRPEARRNLENSYQKDAKQPETMYWLAQMKERPEAGKLLAKYLEICKNNPRATALPLVNERETSYCTHVSEAEKGITP